VKIVTGAKASQFKSMRFGNCCKFSCTSGSVCPRAYGERARPKGPRDQDGRRVKNVLNLVSVPSSEHSFTRLHPPEENRSKHCEYKRTFREISIIETGMPVRYTDAAIGTRNSPSKLFTGLLLHYIKSDAVYSVSTREMLSNDSQ
jgi:hypothetical protein